MHVGARAQSPTDRAILTGRQAAGPFLLYGEERGDHHVEWPASDCGLLSRAGRLEGEKVAEYPDDARNQRCADGLEELVDYVLSLPADDARIIELTTLGVREGLFILPPSDSAAWAVGRFRFDRSDEDCGRFLAGLVRMMRDDAIRQAQFAGEIEVDRPTRPPPPAPFLHL